MALHTLVKRFLNKLAGSWDSFWLRRSRHRLGDAIAPTEPLTRYLIHRKGFFSEVENRVKRRAFMPHPRDNETSVFRIQDAAEPRIWAMGRTFVADPQGRPLYGRADILASLVTDLRLTTRAEDAPPRHAVISGWPQEESERLSLAQELAERATLRMRTQ
jgi:hypothetical protein